MYVWGGGGGREIKRHIRHDSPERDGLAIDIEKMDWKKPSKRKKDVEVHWTRVNVCDASRWSHAVHLSLRREGTTRRIKEKWWHCVIVVWGRDIEREGFHTTPKREKKDISDIYTHTHVQLTCHFAFSRHIKPLLFVAVASRAVTGRLTAGWRHTATASQTFFCFAYFYFPVLMSL